MTDEQLIDLDTCVLNALDLFAQKGTGHLETIPYKRPLVVGSGNAAVTGTILFADTDAVFADESNYMQRLAAVPTIDGAVIISASGAKHAPIIATELKNRGLSVTLLTSTQNAPASKIADMTYVFEKNPEPYTYNTSTYLGMLLAKTGENPHRIEDVITSIKATVPADLSSYDAYYIILPNRLKLLRDMFLTKFDELFGPKLLGRVYTIDETKHAKTLVPSDTELFISLGADDTLFGTKRWKIALAPDAGYGTALSVGYWIIGQIQKANPPYFKEHVDEYVKQASAIFGETLTTIVS